MTFHVRHIGLAVAFTACATAQDAPEASATPVANAPSASVARPNLLTNGSFDRVRGRAPEAWDVFITPDSGAHASAERGAGVTGFAATIEMPEVDASNPVLNWSQNILADLGGKTIEVSGRIKTEEATEAALWVQCWARNPLRVIHGATTFDTTPVYGTQDWQNVAITVIVPEGTAFTTCRCVLRGRGTAWFDDVVATIVATAPTQALASLAPAPATEPPVAIRAPETPAEAPKSMEAQPPDSGPGIVGQNTRAAAFAARAAMNRSLQELFAEPVAERDAINYGTRWTSPGTPWTTGSQNVNALMQWLSNPAAIPTASVPVEQERRR